MQVLGKENQVRYASCSGLDRYVTTIKEQHYELLKLLS